MQLSIWDLHDVASVLQPLRCFAAFATRADLASFSRLSAHFSCRHHLVIVRRCRPVAAPVAAQAPLGLAAPLMPVMALANQKLVFSLGRPRLPPTRLFVRCNYCNQSAHI